MAAADLPSSPLPTSPCKILRDTNLLVRRMEAYEANLSGWIEAGLFEMSDGSIRAIKSNEELHIMMSKLENAKHNVLQAQGQMDAVQDALSHAMAENARYNGITVEDSSES
jgi:hypothetical protein